MSAFLLWAANPEWDIFANFTLQSLKTKLFQHIRKSGKNKTKQKHPEVFVHSKLQKEDRNGSPDLKEEQQEVTHRD